MPRGDVLRWRRTRSGLPSFPFPHDADRTRSADRVLDELERDSLSDPEIIEQSALKQITAMEEDLAIVTEADEPVALAHEDLDNSTDRRFAPKIGRS